MKSCQLMMSLPRLSESLLWLFLKEIAIFSQFYLTFKYFCKFQNHSVLQELEFIILNIAIISYIPQIDQIALTIDMYQENGWEALSLQLLFCIF